ncbi:uncharacterized protein LOC126719665 [Quercus robur]|uniref:uncharacterized protein LOC126719665 n=1 Tax=Quercus robur TaxID=38942 RepID=UPI002161DDDA|nr:uncharacterized protein LOC126719665 [Quercus robur]
MSKALNQISKSPFMHRIEGETLPLDFHQPTFTIYNGRTDSVEHVSHFSQRMTIHSKDGALMCKVFPSSLGLVAMRWFDGLRADSIDSFKELTWTFGFRFITCTRVPRPLDSLLSLSMQERETLKTYLDRYWEIYNGIDGNFDDVTISTFKSGLPTEHSLRKSLIGKPVTSLHQLIDRIDKYKRVEEDQQPGKGKAKDIPQERRDSSGQVEQTGSDPRRDASSRPPLGTINVIFVAPGRIGFHPSRVMSVARLSTEDNNSEPKRAKKEALQVLDFLDEDKIRTIQPHDDALVVILRIGGYDVKRVLVD